MRKIYFLLILLILSFSIIACGHKDYLIKEIDINSEQSELIDDIGKVIVEEKINDNQFFSLYVPDEIEVEKLVGILAIKTNNNHWKISRHVHSLNQKEDITWQMLLFNDNEDKEIGYKTIILGLINDSKINKIMVGNDYQNREYSEAKIIKFQINSEKKRMYYFLSKDDYQREVFGGQASQGFLPEIRGYDKTGNLVVELINGELKDT